MNDNRIRYSITKVASNRYRCRILDASIEDREAANTFDAVCLIKSMAKDLGRKPIRSWEIDSIGYGDEEGYARKIIWEEETLQNQLKGMGICVENNLAIIDQKQPNFKIMANQKTEKPNWLHNMAEWFRWFLALRTVDSRVKREWDADFTN